jgi:hypothetical protein
VGQHHGAQPEQGWARRWWTAAMSVSLGPAASRLRAGCGAARRRAPPGSSDWIRLAVQGPPFAAAVEVANKRMLRRQPRNLLTLINREKMARPAKSTEMSPSPRMRRAKIDQAKLVQVNTTRQGSVLGSTPLSGSGDPSRDVRQATARQR